MKKIIYFLLIIILVAGIAGGAYAGYKYFKKDKDTPATETNILTESKELLNNHASITFGEGDNAWTISTADKLEPIYIDDLRAPGKGVDIGHSNTGGSSVNIPLESFIKIDGANLVGIGINTSNHHNYSISKMNGVWLWNWCSNEIYENLIIANESEISFVENTIKEDGYKAGDNYLLGYYAFTFAFQNIEKYGDTMSNIYNKSFMSNAIVLEYTVPVYYRVK